MRWGEQLLGVPEFDRPLSAVLREHCSWGFQADRAGIELRHHVGVERLIWATDFPHQESEWPHSDQVLARNFAARGDEVRRMVADNAIAFFHLDAAPAAAAANATSAAR